jgi:hypothetical protein
MKCFAHSFPGIFKRIKPYVGRGLISDPPPKTLLHIQSWLICWQVSQTEFDMILNKEFHFFSHMPLRSVYIEPNFIPLQMLIEVLEASDKPLSIPLRKPDQPLSTQQRSHPPKDIEPIMMLTGSRDSEPFPLLAPSDTQTRMQRKSCFIFKYNGLVRLQGSEFFLRPCGIARHPQIGLEDRSNWPASAHSPVGASSIGLGAPLTLSQNSSLSVQLRWGRPNELDSAQTPKGTSLIARPVPGEFGQSNDRDVRVLPWISRTSTLLCSPCASIHSSFDASCLRSRKPIPDADPPKSAKEPLPLNLHRPPGLSEHKKIYMSIYFMRLY